MPAPRAWTWARRLLARAEAHPWRRPVVGAIAIATLVAAYSVLSWRVHLENPTNTTIPTWSQLADGVEKIVRVDPIEDYRWIVVDAKATLERFGAGLAVGAIGAVILGVLMGAFWPIGDFFLPLLTFLSKIPPTAAMAVFFVLADIGMALYVSIIAFGVLPTMALAVHQSVGEVHAELIEKARTLGASRIEVVWNVLVPHVTPQILNAFLLQIGPAMVFLIPAEMLVGSEGFGYRIRLLGRRQEMNVVYSYLALLATFGFTVDYLVRQVQALACPWYSRSRLSGPVAWIAAPIRRWLGRSPDDATPEADHA